MGIRGALPHEVTVKDGKLVLDEGYPLHVTVNSKIRIGCHSLSIEAFDLIVKMVKEAALASE